jgi:hypothetical protein
MNGWLWCVKKESKWVRATTHHTASTLLKKEVSFAEASTTAQEHEFFGMMACGKPNQPDGKFT